MMAPPWMRVSERWSQRSLRSLRMVCAETSKRRARSSTITRPNARAMLRISFWRWVRPVTAAPRERYLPMVRPLRLRVNAGIRRLPFRRLGRPEALTARASRSNRRRRNAAALGRDRRASDARDQLHQFALALRAGLAKEVVKMGLHGPRRHAQHLRHRLDAADLEHRIEHADFARRQSVMPGQHLQRWGRDGHTPADEYRGDRSISE